MIVKILGAIDLGAAITILFILFGADVFTQILLFFAALLFLKGLFIFSGEPLSLIDISSSLLLVLSIFFSPFAVLLWIAVFLLIAKGVVSFI